jgi:hypothetical protein
MRCHCEQHGIVIRLSCPYTSSQNGKTERIIRTLNDCIRSMLLHAGLPTEYWVEALSTATHLINRRPCRTSGRATPKNFFLAHPPPMITCAFSGAFVSPTSHSPWHTSSANDPPPCSSRVPYRSSWVSLLRHRHTPCDYIAPCGLRRNLLPFPLRIE